MIYIELNENNEVMYAHHNPTKLTKEYKEKGLELNLEIPKSEKKIGKQPILYYTKEKGFWYEYEDIPKSKEEMLEERIDLMQKALDELLLGGAI